VRERAGTPRDPGPGPGRARLTARARAHGTLVRNWGVRAWPRVRGRTRLGVPDWGVPA